MDKARKRQDKIAERQARKAEKKANQDGSGPDSGPQFEAIDPADLQPEAFGREPEKPADNKGDDGEDDKGGGG